MAFTAQDVKALRERTGVGMMDCKKALAAAGGDMEKAIDILREKGMAAAAKKAGRIAAEGTVLAYTDEEKQVGVLVEVNCETDFAAKNAKFRDFVLDVAKTIAKEAPTDVEALLEVRLVGSDRTVRENLQDLVLSIGENIKVRRFERAGGAVSTYIHGGGAVGVMVRFGTGAAGTAGFMRMGKDVAMQVAAMSPSFLNRASVPDEVVEHERAIVRAQLAEDPKMANKPEQVLAKIADGKLGKFYKESCLLEQTFIRDDSVTVGQYVESAAKALGAEIKVTGFARYAVGEGCEKRI